MQAQDLLVLNKQLYSDQISSCFNQRGQLRRIVSSNNDVRGIVRSEPIIGIQTAYERFNDEAIQPTQPSTSEVLMRFRNHEAASTLSFKSENEISNPNYIQELSNQNGIAIATRVEQTIIEGMTSVPTVNSNQFNPYDIDNGYKINGDGTPYTNSGGEQVLNIEGLLKLQQMFNDMGTVEDQRFVYLPSDAVFGLMTGPDKDQFTNVQYTGNYNLMNMGQMYTFLGMTLIVAQGNPFGGLPSSGAGKYAFAFSTDATMLSIQEGGVGADMWIGNDNQCYKFIARSRAGFIIRRPSNFIKIACKTPA